MIVYLFFSQGGESLASLHCIMKLMKYFMHISMNYLAAWKQHSNVGFLLFPTLWTKSPLLLNLKDLFVLHQNISNGWGKRFYQWFLVKVSNTKQQGHVLNAMHSAKSLI